MRLRPRFRGAGVTLVNHPVEPATAYRVNLTVSGNVTLIGMVNAPGYPKQRFDFLPGAILEEKPQVLSGVFTTRAADRSFDDHRGSGTLFFDRIRIGVPRSIGNVLRLRPDRLGGWYFKGEPVRLLVKGSVPSNLESVEARVENDRGRTVGSFRCSAATMRKEGMLWTPPEPGFHRIYLTALFADGTKQSVREDYKDGI